MIQQLFNFPSDVVAVCRVGRLTKLARNCPRSCHRKRVALVTDIEWVQCAVRALSFLIPGDVRVLLPSETAQARAWTSWHFASGKARASRSTCALLARLFSAIGFLSLGACGPAPGFHARDISTTLPPLKFTLAGQAGKTITEEAVRGKVTLLYFGYTNSPDACPATLLKLALALERLGDDAGSVRILFVSVDPQRDSPALLASYVDGYTPEMMGLTGSESELVALTKRYRVAFRRDAPDARGAYAVYHSNDVLAFDRDGRARLLITPSETEEQLSEDLQALIG